MELKQKILQFARKYKKLTTSMVLKMLKNKVSRQFVSRIIGELVIEGKLVKSGSTKKSFYALPENVETLGISVNKNFQNRNLEEDIVLDEIISRQMPLFQKIPENIRRIFRYGFLEILNNAIEHSQSDSIKISITLLDNRLSFEVNDFGIGVFNSVMKKLKLKSELEVIQDILKGKTTTDPRSHSGEGIFFVSKAADIFILESFNHRLRIDNQLNDVFIEPIKREKRGTKATFIIDINSNKQLEKIFKLYQSGDDFAFDKTKIKIKLFQIGSQFVSRSEARRLVPGLEKFRTVVLDFDKIETVGQGFADEVFRVFKNKHKEIDIKPINMNKTVDFMIKRSLG